MTALESDAHDPDKARESLNGGAAAVRRDVERAAAVAERERQRGRIGRRPVWVGDYAATVERLRGARDSGPIDAVEAVVVTHRETGGVIALYTRDRARVLLARQPDSGPTAPPTGPEACHAHAGGGRRGD